MALTCPRCQEIGLEEIEIGEVVVDRCPRCAGIWFDNAEIGAIVGRQSKTGQLDSIIPMDAADERSFNCPRCQEGVPLRVLEVDMEDQIARFYRCKSCIGTWIDRGELRRVEDTHLANVLKTFFSGIDTNG